MSSFALPLLAQWILLANHTHTVASPDSTLRLADLDRMAKERGIQAVVVTDHNTVRAVLDPVFHASGSVTFIEGQEWGSDLGSPYWGHVGLIGLRGDVDVDPGLALAGLFAESRERGALAVVNHPFNWILSWRTEEVPAEAGGVEVWNQAWHTWGMGNSRALTWWDAALRRGRRLVAVGGSDVHGLSIGDAPVTTFRIDTPVNMVWAEEASPASIMEALHAGRLAIGHDSGAPRVALAAEVGGQLAGLGDLVAASGPVAIPVRVSGGQGLVLSLHTRQGRVFESRITTPDYAVRAAVGIAPGRDFVRAELREPGGWPEPAMVTMTNPIYFESHTAAR